MLNINVWWIILHLYINYTIQKFGVSRIFLFFFFYLIKYFKMINSNIQKYYNL